MSSPIVTNKPAHTDLLADTDLWIKDAATQVDAALQAGYQYGYFTGSTSVYDTYGTCGITVPGLKTIVGALGSVIAARGNDGPCLFQIASYNAGGPGTVYGQVWRWPYVATVELPPVPPATIGKLARQLQPMVPAPKGTVLTVCVLAWGTP